MVKIEQIEFENYAKFQLAIEKIVNKEDVFRTIQQKDKEPIKRKIISNGRLYVGNNYALQIQKANNGKVYLSIDYFSVEDRIAIAKNKKDIGYWEFGDDWNTFM